MSIEAIQTIICSPGFAKIKDMSHTMITPKNINHTNACNVSIIRY